MKKFFSTAVSAILCTALLTGCGGNDAAETISEAAVVSEETTTVSETSVTSETAETETVPETSEISETAETTTETEITETEKVFEVPEFEKIDMSGYTGNFYEWEYDYSIVAYDRESFAGGGDIIGAAEVLLADEDGLLFEEGVWEDFDGDGKKEGFLLFSHESDEWWGKSYETVFADSEGGVRLLEESAGAKGSLNPMRYNGFLHMCTDFGADRIASLHMEIYAVEENSAVEKYTDFFKGKPLDGAFMVVSHPQGGGERIIFWNEQRREFCQIDGERVPEEDINDILASEAYAGSYYENFAEKYKEDKATGIRMSFFNYGGKYFCTASGYGYERSGGEIIRTEREISISECYCTNTTGVDINKAEAEMIRLEK